MHSFSFILSLKHDRNAFDRALRSVLAQRRVEDQIIILADLHAGQFYDFRDLAEKDLVYSFKGNNFAWAKNKVKHYTECDFVIFLDETQLLPDNYIKGISCLIKQDNVVYTNYSVFNQEAIVSLTDFDTNDLFTNSFLPSGCFLYPAKIVNEFSFDDDLDLLEDWDFQLNILTNVGIGYMPVPGPILTAPLEVLRGSL